MWYSDNNVRVRQRFRVGIIAQLTRVLRVIVAGGVDEGTFVVTDLEMTSRVVATLVQDLNDELADEARTATVERTVAAYTWAIERILGLPEGSIVLADLTRLADAVADRGARPG